VWAATTEILQKMDFLSTKMKTHLYKTWPNSSTKLKSLTLLLASKINFFNLSQVLWIPVWIKSAVVWSGKSQIKASLEKHIEAISQLSIQHQGFIGFHPLSWCQSQTSIEAGSYRKILPYFVLFIKQSFQKSK
jgi:hypothetical protein